MLTRIHTALLTALLLGILFNAQAHAEGKSYRDYQVKSQYQDYFQISYDSKTITIVVFDNNTTISVTYPLTSIVRTEKQISFNDSVFFDSEGLQFGASSYPYLNIHDSRIYGDDNHVTIMFRTRRGASDRPKRIRRGNRITFDRDMVIEEDEFVRGIIFSVSGNIEVYGEVNKDIISLFGDIYVGPGAVARGDIATITGRLDLARDASVYGESYNGPDNHQKRRHRFYRKHKTGSVSATFKYNRVDGATPYMQLKFADQDSLLPTVWILGGYGFESKRGRFDIGLEQTLWRKRPLVIGGSFYRRLASEDDWLLSDHENLAFTLLATEDFKDYYEAEGGKIYMKFKPAQQMTFETSFRYEETNWLKAQAHLWSMFGGDKLFRRNYSTVDSAYREHGMREVDTTANAALSIGLDWNTVDTKDPFINSAWHFSNTLEWSHPNFGSDFDYRRYTVTLRRYQQIHRRTMLIMRAMFGGSDGYLPMNKRYFLGGLGTLRGYKHKEYMGTRFWMTNMEYRVSFPRSDLAASVFWDVGQIANETKLSSDIDIKHSLGIALFIGDDFRINMSKRLDRSFDDNPKFYVRLDHVF